MDNLDLKWNLETKSSHSIFVGYENESISSKIINHAENGNDIIIILENTLFIPSLEVKLAIRYNKE